MSYFANNPEKLYEIPPDFFEKLVAHILVLNGFEVNMNVRLGGFSSGDEADILAFKKSPPITKPFGLVVECKRFSPNRKVSLSVATRLYGLKTLHAAEGINCAMLATTSKVSGPTHRQYDDLVDFDIKEHDDIVELLKLHSSKSQNLYFDKFVNKIKNNSRLIHIIFNTKVEK